MATKKENKFVVKEFKEVVGGEYDEFGFYTTLNGSFWDPDGIYFNRDGFDKNGGYYDDKLEYIPGESWDHVNLCYPSDLIVADSHEYLDYEDENDDDYGIVNNEYEDDYLDDEDELIMNDPNIEKIQFVENSNDYHYGEYANNQYNYNNNYKNNYNNNYNNNNNNNNNYQKENYYQPKLENIVTKDTNVKQENKQVAQLNSNQTNKETIKNKDDEPTVPKKKNKLDDLFGDSGNKKVDNKKATTESKTNTVKTNTITNTNTINNITKDVSPIQNTIKKPIQEIKPKEIILQKETPKTIPNTINEQTQKKIKQEIVLEGNKLFEVDPNEFVRNKNSQENFENQYINTNYNNGNNFNNNRNNNNQFNNNKNYYNNNKYMNNMNNNMDYDNKKGYNKFSNNVNVNQNYNNQNQNQFYAQNYNQFPMNNFQNFAQLNENQNTPQYDQHAMMNMMQQQFYYYQMSQQQQQPNFPMSNFNNNNHNN